MTKYRVWVEKMVDSYVDIEAESEDAAYDYAMNVLDEDDFKEDDADFSFKEITELDNDADVDFVVSEEEEE